MNSKEVHKSFANVLIMSFLVCGIYVFFRLSGVESYWLFATALITGFYFWWGYVFMGEKVYHSRTISDFFFDFIVGVVLYALMLVIPLLNLRVWLYLFLLLFCLAIIKYIIISFRIKTPKLSYFVGKKILTDLSALIFVSFMIGIAMILNKWLFLIVALFFMEFSHILYVSFVDKIYEF